MKVDLSSEAISLRLKQVEDLRRLCLSLGKARIVKDKKDVKDDKDKGS